MLSIKDEYVLLISPKGEETEIVKKFGYKTILISKKVSMKQSVLNDKFYEMDLNDTALIEEFVKKNSLRYNIVAAFTLNEYRIPLMARVNEFLNNTNSMTIAGTEICRDKILQRKVIDPIYSPKFEEVALADVPKVSTTFPLVLKAKNDAGSRNVFFCRNELELQKNLSFFQTGRLNHIGQSIGEVVLVEEFVHGKEFSAELVVINNNIYFCSFTEKLISDNELFFEIGHISNFNFPLNEQAQIQQALNSIIDTIQIKNAVLHIEFKISNSEFKLIEVNCRPAGDNIVKLNQLSFDIDLNQISFELMIGKINPELFKNLNNSKKRFAINFFYAKHDLSNLTYPSVDHINHLIEIKKTKKPNTPIKKTISNYNRYGYIISHFSEESQSEIKKISTTLGR